MFDIYRSMFKLQYRSVLQAMMLLSLFAASCISVLHAQEQKPQPKALLEQIWRPLPPLNRALNKQDQEYAESALIEWLKTYLRDEYEVIDQQFFLEKQKTIGMGFDREWICCNHQR